MEFTEGKMRKEIGKIQSCRFGMGGYDDVMFGVTFTLSGKGWGVGDFWGTWSWRSESAQWSEADQIRLYGEMVARVNKLMKAAKVNRFEELKDVPVEVTFEGNTISSWRILVEVL